MIYWASTGLSGHTTSPWSTSPRRSAPPAPTSSARRICRCFSGPPTPRCTRASTPAVRSSPTAPIPRCRPSTAGAPGGRAPTPSGPPREEADALRPGPHPRHHHQAALGGVAPARRQAAHSLGKSTVGYCDVGCFAAGRRSLGLLGDAVGGPTMTGMSPDAFVSSMWPARRSAGGTCGRRGGGPCCSARPWRVPGGRPSAGVFLPNAKADLSSQVAASRRAHCLERPPPVMEIEARSAEPAFCDLADQGGERIHVHPSVSSRGHGPRGGWGLLLGRPWPSPSRPPATPRAARCSGQHELTMCQPSSTVRRLRAK